MSKSPESHDFISPKIPSRLGDFFDDNTPDIDLAREVASEALSMSSARKYINEPLVLLLPKTDEYILN